MTKSKTTISVFSFEKKRKKTGNDFSIKFPFVVPLGLEPRAYGLENRCSIQLSYRTKFFKNNFPNPDIKYFSYLTFFDSTSNINSQGIKPLAE